MMYNNGQNPMPGSTGDVDPALADKVEVLMNRTHGIVNLMEFNASGDGVTDDTDALLHVLQETDFKRVFIPGGTYLMNLANVVINREIQFIGQDRELVTFLGSSATPLPNPVFDVRASIRLKGITFMNMGRVLDYRNLADGQVLDYLFIEDCRFDNVWSPVYSYNSFPAAGFNEVVLRRNDVTNVVRGFYLERNKINSAKVHDNSITNIADRQAILLGSVADSSFQNSVQQVNVEGNVIKNVSGTNAANGIMVGGLRAIISGNHVENVSQNSDPRDDSEGIYTKCRYSVISNNILVNAGRREGMINIKGRGRADMDAPQGFAVICANNQLYCTEQGMRGIHIQTDDVLVSGNMLEGLTDYAVYTDIANKSLNNIQIVNNNMRNFKGAHAIYCSHYGTGLEVSGNTIYELTGEFASGKPVIGINVSLSQMSSLDLVHIASNKIIHSPEGVDSRGIHVHSGPASLTDVTIKDNRIDGADKGIGVSGASAIQGLVIVHNELYNIHQPEHWIYRSGNVYPTKLLIGGNIGFVSETRGTATILAGSASIVIQHGLSRAFGLDGTAAIHVHATPLHTLGLANKFWVSDVNNLSFTLRIDVAASEDILFSWSAIKSFELAGNE